MSEVQYIFDGNIDKLATSVEKLNKRAAKLGVPAIQLHIGERETIYTAPGAGAPAFSASPKAWGEDTKVQSHERATVSLHGEPPKLAGWTFAAVVDHLSNGTITRYPHAETEVDLKPFRGSDATCDHCQTVRNRHETFIVVHDTGNIQRVGRNCLADFLGHANPASLIGHLRLWSKAFELVEGASEAGIGSGTPTLFLLGFLAHVAREMRQHGWLSRSAAYAAGENTRYGGRNESYHGKTLYKQGTGVATADAAQNAYWHDGFGLTDAEKLEMTPTDEDEARGRKALEWARKLADSDVEDNDYLYNLRAVCADDTIRPKRGGLAGSVIVAAERAFEKLAQAQRDAAKSNLHRGTIGARETDSLTLVGTREIDGYYGVSTLHRFEDAAGNLLVWFASNPRIMPTDDGDKRALAVGETATLAFTVKGHDDYKGRKQTKLGRVSAPRTKAAKKRAPQA